MFNAKLVKIPVEITSRLLTHKNFIPAEINTIQGRVSYALREWLAVHDEPTKNGTPNSMV